jgi:hypothetical protein
VSAKTPAWLEAALAHRQVPTKPASLMPIRAGQIRRLEPMDAGTAHSVLVLVTDTDDANACASVAVVSPEVEMGSDADFALPRATSGLPYELIVLPDVVGPAWFVQLGPELAAVNMPLNELNPAGIALRDAQDSRWAWKESILDALVALTAECRYQLLDGEPAAIADPAAFDLNLVGVEDRTCMTLATVRLLGMRSILLPTTVLRLTPVGQASPAYESFVALSETILRHTSQVISDAPAGLSEIHLERELEDDPLPRAVSALLQKLDESTRCIKITSVSSLWSQPNQDIETRFFGLLMNGKRHQMIIANADVTEACCA